MRWMSTNELREKFLNFFESKQHLRQESFSLIPKDDNSLLLINSGMAPLKKYFTGEVTPPSKRIATCQKCIRTPDIERVGITARHGTFFEMLGNFSFGDYFKKDAIKWAWEFFTEVLEIPTERLWVSVFEKDDETFDIWNDEIAVPEDRIVRMGAGDNFWEHGKGPCGPCSEIYFDRGEKYSCGKPSCCVGCECDRYVEVWNLVFSQFFSDGNGNYSDLAQKNIDTGMGLERLACVMQDVDNLFMIDTVQNIINKVCALTKVEYGKDCKTDIAIRVITDHVRSTTFMAADGVSPSNDGRGYVFRRLLRRAARYGRLLGMDCAFLAQVAETVINESKVAYPELEEKREYICKLINAEEENFSRTIDQGLNVLKDVIKSVKESGEKTISGKDVFKLNDTYGFPIDLTREIAAEKYLNLDEEGFEKLLSEQRTRARNARKNAGKEAWLDSNIKLDMPPTQFVGYEHFKADAEILAIINGNALTESCKSGDDVIVIIDKTPFYAQGGGQVGDSGYIENTSARMTVLDTQRSANGHFMHHAKVLWGEFTVHDKVIAKVDKIRRADIMKNHTAAHILQAALKKVLGKHVSQAGQLVNEKSLRFDFTHFSAMKKQEIQEVEDIVNDEIFKAIDVNVCSMKLDEAKKAGATALFDEKYGEEVRVVSLTDGFSQELCGGTHVDNTSKLSMFKIIYEGSVAAGVRRIEAVTAKEVMVLLRENCDLLDKLSLELKTNDINSLPQICEELSKENKRKDKVINELQTKIANSKVDEMLAEAIKINGLKLISKDLENTDLSVAKSMSDTLKNKSEYIVTVFTIRNGKKLNLLCSAGKEAVKLGVNSGKLVNELAVLASGKGGGKADFAMAGISDASKVKLILSEASKILKLMVE